MMTCNEGNIYFQRIEAVRKIMRTKGLDAVVISGSDPHASEYPALRWKQVELRVCGTIPDISSWQSNNFR